LEGCISFITDDLADACAFAIENITADDIYTDGATHLNVGTGEECSIEDLAKKNRASRWL